MMCYVAEQLFKTLKPELCNKKEQESLARFLIPICLIDDFIRNPAAHKGVPSVSMSRRFGILSGLPRLEFRSMKGAMFRFLHSS